jgi:glycosyltransferase involved in cell wall biosynthesis
MNVVFFSWEYPPNGAGVGSYVYHMSRTLVQSGHRVLVVTGHRPGEGDESCEEEGVVVRRCYGWEELRERRVGELVLAAARDFGADFIEGADHLGELASLMHVADRPPLMVRMHSCNVHRVLHASQAWYRWQRVLIWLSCMRMWRQVRAERQTIARADAVVAPSRRLLDASLSQGLRLPEVRGVVPNPYVVPPGRYAACADESLTPTLLFVGRLDMGKGIGYLPELMRSVRASFPEAILEIAGGDSYARGVGSLRHWLESQFESVGVAAGVRWLGHLGLDELDAAYRRAWVQVVPSRWDTFPGVVLEGMARAKPLVVSPHGGIPEMVDGAGAQVADPATEAFAEAVQRYIGDRALRQETGEQSRKRVLDTYSPARVGEQYMEFVDRWLSKKKS